MHHHIQFICLRIIVDFNLIFVHDEPINVSKIFQIVPSLLRKRSDQEFVKVGIHPVNFTLLELVFVPEDDHVCQVPTVMVDHQRCPETQDHLERGTDTTDSLDDIFYTIIFMCVQELVEVEYDADLCGQILLIIITIFLYGF